MGNTMTDKKAEFIRALVAINLGLPTWITVRGDNVPRYLSARDDGDQVKHYVLSAPGEGDTAPTLIDDEGDTLSFTLRECKQWDVTFHYDASAATRIEINEASRVFTGEVPDNYNWELPSALREEGELKLQEFYDWAVSNRVPLYMVIGWSKKGDTEECGEFKSTGATMGRLSQSVGKVSRAARSPEEKADSARDMVASLLRGFK